MINFPYCFADENRLQQILQNLVANAIKFTSSGSVTVSAMQNAEMIDVSVADTGMGIEKSKQEVIFQEFEQADGSIAREFGGTGLGLSISKYLVELHGGKIKLESTLDKGSTFTFSIPVYSGAVSATPSSDNNWKLQHSGPIEKQNGHQAIIKRTGDNQPLKEILIVDDEPVNLKVLKNHLEHAGYGVTMAKDGHEALMHLQNGKKFHLVLLDVMMPRIPGYEVCQKIREKYLLSELPVIMVTAKNQLSDLVEGLSVGANDYINKPFSKDELLSRVKTQLQTFDIYEATGRFVPHQFIQSLGRHGITDLKRGDMVERNVHVMFSDIRDYTSLAEEMTPIDNFKFVNSLASKVGPIVKTNDGIINQYLGDTIMMLFLHKADDGVQAAIEIHRMLEGYNTNRKNKNRKLVKLGIGIHSGPLIMGIIGDSERTEAAVISDTVNTASRMEGLTKHFGVNLILSEATLDKIEDRNKFNIRFLGKVQVKGKYQPIKIYECFDVDNSEQAILKKKTLSHFTEGITAYYQKDMLKALHHFEAVYQANPADLTAFGFLHKVHSNIVNGLSEDWNGVETMHFK
ncbi:MAG TPA: response regulator [Saprospiraceae bacterium]|nr:response regulator [Saprospiraceae bacterium]